MNNNFIFLADGFEEIEALATLDMLRRAGMEVKSVSINPTRKVQGAHGLIVEADILMTDVAAAEAEWLILPGGLPGATNLAACEPLATMLKKQVANGRHVAAICASPAMVLAPLGLLEGRKATCYPGCEGACKHEGFTGNPVEVDGPVITGKGPGYTFEFALAIITTELGDAAAQQVASGMLLR